jgi:hypothetical protein
MRSESHSPGEWGPYYSIPPVSSCPSDSVTSGGNSLVVPSGWQRTPARYMFTKHLVATATAKCPVKLSDVLAARREL